MTASSHSTAALGAFKGRLALVGAGKMGSAMLEGWLALGLDPASVTVIEPSPAPEVAALTKRGVRVIAEAAKESAMKADTMDTIVLAVKPQVAPAIMAGLKPLATAKTLTISIMAGQTIAAVAGAIGGAVVRAMPNTPAAIGRGMTVAVANAAVTDTHRALAHALLAANGKVEWVADEALMDAVTAVSGSGPAYVFLLVECLAQAGVAAGLAPDLALALARETVAGSGELLHRSTLDAATLRKNVTSPGGTTAAALDVLMARDGLAPLMQKAVAAATQRSRELAG
ncbi:MAG TPA: pyrroline-5-carboxylate reductase [Xanthobacteraceae bacterium]|jgi:pyrroline-5-carboxylate reductase|nr:pyrroline-5-carboxylate reductase [Xanthobacteraceae bacterium]